MQAHNNNIEEYLSVPRTIFVVPVYQRNYDWKEANCKQLFHDICGVISSGKEHFLGTICFKDYSSHERSIIDGQQRLTSITLLLKALYDITDDEDIKEEIRDSYFYNKGHSIDTDYLKVKLHLNKRNDIVFRLLLDNTADTVDEKLTTRQRESRVYQNYKLFGDLIQNYFSRGGQASGLLDSLCKLTIIELEVQDENPQEIFESLNSTGLDLTNVDLLRNYFLMQFPHEQQSELYENFWSKIEDSVGVDHMEQFFVDYLIFKRRSDSISIGGRRAHINEKNLYVAFKDYYNNLVGDNAYTITRDCFADLKRCSDIYKDFIFNSDVNIEKESPLRKKLYYLLGVNDSGKSKSLLLYVFNLYREGKINDNDINEVLDAVTSLSFRARICKAKGINSQFAGNVMIRLDTISDYSDFQNKFWEAITVGKGSFAFPSDEDFKRALMQKDMYQVLRSRGTKYMLYMLELHSPFHKGLPSFEDETLSIEHVMPQTLNDEWKNYLTDETLENYDVLVTKLGNLALTNYNSEMSNNSFEDKQKIYKESNFYNTRALTEYKKWSVVEINRRTEKMAKEALEIWKLPEKYQSSSPAHESLHTLDEDFTQFAYTKPSTILIQDEEFTVNAWAELLPIVCNSFLQDDKDVFREIAHEGTISAFAISDEDHSYAENMAYEHIDQDVYIRTAMSAYSTLNTISKLVNSFDEKADTDYKDNVMFTLR
jgi:uncharacterized protein with ParB-like and HNH nuclease domain